MKPAAIYSRVSTLEQATHGTSLDTQTQACKEYAQTNGYTVIREIREDASGAYLGRPGLDEVRNLAERHEIEAVIVTEQDRLSRDIAHTYLLLDEFKRAGVKLAFVLRPLEETAEGKAWFGIEAVFKELERAKIAERCRRGRQRRVREGKIPRNRVLPYGYRYVPEAQTFKIEEGEACYVRLMFDMLVNGRYSLHDICRKLDAMGAPLRHAKCWQRSSLHSILKNHVYTGTWYSNKREHVVPVKPIKEHRCKEKSTQRPRPQEDWIPVNVPAVISQELFDAAQARLAQNKEHAGRPATSQYLLRGLLFCPACHRRLKASKSGNQRWYYQCTGRDDDVMQHECPTPSLKGPKVEAETWAKVAERLTNKRLIIDTVRQRDEVRKHERTKDDAELSVLYEHQRKLKAETDKLIDMHLQGDIDREAYRERVAVINKKQESIQQAEAEIHERIRSRDITVANEEEIVRFCTQAQQMLPSFTFEDRRQLLEALQLRGTVLEGGRRIDYTWMLSEPITILLDSKAAAASGEDIVHAPRRARPAR